MAIRIFDLASAFRSLPGVRRKALLGLALASAVLAAGCASLPRDVQRTPAYAIADTADTRLSGEVGPLTAAHPNLSGFHTLPEGIEAFAARVALIRHAEKTLDLQYYIWHDDLTGKVLHNQLLDAADRGVRIRLLLDDLDTAGKDELLHIIDAHPNIEIRLFNPFANRKHRIGDLITDGRRIDHRMHDKSITADNQVTIFGGRNIGDEYFDAGEDVGFQDLDVVAVGPVVKEVSQVFDLFWNSEWVYPLAVFVDGAALQAEQIEAFRRQSDEFMEQAMSSEYVEAIRSLDMAKLKGFAELDYSWGKWILMYDDPGKPGATSVSAQTHLAPNLKRVIDETRGDLIIVSPYFVPGPRFTADLVGMVERGVRVRILTNSLASNDVALVHAGYMRYRKALIEGGVELYEFKPTRDVAKGGSKTKARWSGSSRASLHGKFLGFDRRYLFVGSFNLDGRSVALNTEMGVYFESRRYAELLFDIFEENAMIKAYRVTLTDEGRLQWVTLEDGEEVRFDTEPETGFWKRFGAGFFSIFAPEREL